MGTKYLEWDKVTKMTYWKTVTNTVSSTLISYAFTRVNSFIRVTQELTRHKWLYHNISARDISRIIFTSLVCHVLQITCSFIHDTFSEQFPSYWTSTTLPLFDRFVEWSRLSDYEFNTPIEVRSEVRSIMLPPRRSSLESTYDVLDRRKIGSATTDVVTVSTGTKDKY